MLNFASCWQCRRAQQQQLKQQQEQQQRQRFLMPPPTQKINSPRKSKLNFAFSVKCAEFLRSAVMPAQRIALGICTARGSLQHRPQIHHRYIYILHFTITCLDLFWKMKVVTKLFIRILFQVRNYFVLSACNKSFALNYICYMV